jgi:hypothetical protein
MVKRVVMCCHEGTHTLNGPCMQIAGTARSVRRVCMCAHAGKCIHGPRRVTWTVLQVYMRMCVAAPPTSSSASQAETTALRKSCTYVFADFSATDAELFFPNRALACTVRERPRDGACARVVRAILLLCGTATLFVQRGDL